MDSQISWDSIRKPARKLEAQLDEQMSSYRKLVSSIADGSESDLESGIDQLLKQLQQEFYRLRSSLRAKQEHASLLQEFREFDQARVDLEQNGGFEGQALLKEQASVNRSTGQMDTIISQAQATLGTLVLQRSTFSGISSKMTNVSSLLPSVNHILSVIKRKKSMDTIILSLLASVCTFLILIDWLTK